MENREMEDQILEAAFRVVDRYTISGTRMHLIAEEAQMVQSNLHYYFKTKQDLLLALLRYIQRDFSRNRQAIMEQSPETLEGQIGGFFKQKLSIIKRAPQYDRVQIDFWNLGQIDEEVNDSFYESFNIWRKQIFEVIRLYGQGISKEKAWLASCVMISMMMGASLQYLNFPGFDLEEYFNACQKMILYYIEES